MTRHCTHDWANTGLVGLNWMNQRAAASAALAEASFRSNRAIKSGAARKGSKRLAVPVECKSHHQFSLALCYSNSVALNFCSLERVCSSSISSAPLHFHILLLAHISTQRQQHTFQVHQKGRVRIDCGACWCGLRWQRVALPWPCYSFLLISSPSFLSAAHFRLFPLLTLFARIYCRDSQSLFIITEHYQQQQQLCLV